MIKAVLFDLDDTLYCEHDYVDQAFYAVAKVIGGYLQKQSCERDVSRIQKRMWELLTLQGRGHIFDTICQEYQVSIPIAELVEIYRRTKPVLSLYPDAQELLQKLWQKGIRTGLITDGCSQVQHAKIDALPALERMDVILATDDLGVNEQGKAFCKPHPYVYEYCLEKLGCIPQEAVYVGDNPSKDFWGARSLGMQTVRIVRRKGEHMKDIAEEGKEADFVVHTLLELETLF